jgi:adenylylsulfate kinase
MGENIIPHAFSVETAMRERLNGHRGAVLWFTGLSGSGKSTLAHALDERLYRRGVHTYVLDGDNVRSGLNSDLGFSAAEREENIRRIGEVSRLFADAGLITITAFISPYRAGRERVRALLPAGRFIEVYVKCPLPVAEERDPKGLYKKARAGEIPQFTGVSDPYEEPEEPEVIVDTSEIELEEALSSIEHYLVEKEIITRSSVN